MRESFGTLLLKAFSAVPKNDGEPNGRYAHVYLRRHATFRGRPYRRGKTRCLYCGALMTAQDGPPDPARHLTFRQRLVAQLTRTNPLLNWLRSNHA